MGKHWLIKVCERSEAKKIGGGGIAFLTTKYEQIVKLQHLLSPKVDMAVFIFTVYMYMLHFFSFDEKSRVHMHYATMWQSVKIFFFYFYLVSDRLQLVEAYITFVGYACKKNFQKLKG